MAQASADLVDSVREQDPVLDLPLDSSNIGCDEEITSGAADVHSAESNHFQTPASDATALVSMSLYDLFLVKLAEATQVAPQTVEKLEEHTGLGKAQLNVWLKKAVNEGKVEKLKRPVRYQLVAVAQLDWVKPSDGS